MAIQRAETPAYSVSTGGSPLKDPNDTQNLIDSGVSSDYNTGPEASILIYQPTMIRRFSSMQRCSNASESAGNMCFIRVRTRALVVVRIRVRGEVGCS